VRQDPGSAEGHYLVGLSLWYCNNTTESAREFLAAVHINPQHAAAHHDSAHNGRPSAGDVNLFPSPPSPHHPRFAGAPHGWLNDTMPGRYRRAQAEAAWAAQLAFLQRVLALGYDRSTRSQHYAADIAADYDFSRNVRQE